VNRRSIVCIQKAETRTRARRRAENSATGCARAIVCGIIPIVTTTLEGRACESCYGTGQVPTDGGPTPCSDCGGSGHLPRPDTNVEWRLREIERALSGAGDETTQSIQWLAFELRRARGALTEILTLSADLPESPDATRLRFIANRALDMYDEISVGAPAPGAKS
jgi:hypothetical protein